MKIEIGENLCYSWLRHVKECQIVQTNWKSSTSWNIKFFDKLEKTKKTVDDFFKYKYDYEIFKKNTSLSQLLKQGECDVLGISYVENSTKLYALDVAFHENGLQYGSKHETVMKIIEKMVRTALSVNGYFELENAEIVFASPKINNSVLSLLEPCVKDLNAIFIGFGYKYDFRLIANSDFESLILNPVLLLSDDISDTTELFMRSYKMISMFSNSKNEKVKKFDLKEKFDIKQESIREIKIGKVANIILRDVLQSRNVSMEEILNLQDKRYSKELFNINYPLLVKSSEKYEKVRYYVEPLTIYGNKYVLCSQWIESSRNRLEKWINEHQYIDS